MRLVFEGHRPDIAIFVDGINDFYRRGAQPRRDQVLSQLYDNWDSNDLNACPAPACTADDQSGELASHITRFAKSCYGD